MAKAPILPEFRARLSEKLMELGNLIAVVLAIGQFVSEKGFSMGTFVLGIVLSVSCYIVSYMLSM